MDYLKLYDNLNKELKNLAEQEWWQTVHRCNRICQIREQIIARENSVSYEELRKDYPW